jgi:Ala-tRNA(Pro) deacylase
MTIVTEHLESLGLRFEVLPHARAFTAVGEAITLGVPTEEVIKGVVLDIGTGHALAILPASRRLDLDLVRQALGEPHVGLATEDEIERDYPEFELGAIPPLPSLLHVPVVIDPTVFEHARVTFAAGTTKESVRVDPEHLFTGATITVAPVTRPPDVPAKDKLFFEA